ncbi:hypothetical protein PLESTB_000219700 [Pleodorina starrii]|uniref:Uncharacterized protein n=1 Tax=Pleodorina starrii TaxID=330485 RepID=A0A9W6BC62_9CHLO|nr:hypothetical protein PLESTM_001545400 [Pleodorina starrii]GLC49442.1 hypothetical protein PLESTB_000219700 [Pleodorina starrii]GLC75675.1 hypothetical protein PLESTF_001672700 [Pleodorina starrii]
MRLSSRGPVRDHRVLELRPHRPDLMVNSDSKRCSSLAAWKNYLISGLLIGLVILWASNRRFKIVAGDARGQAVAAGSGTLNLGSGTASGGHDEELMRRRAIGAVLGALVADAATMGLHWIYDMDRISGLVSEHGRSEEPAFFQPPSCPYYEYESGSLSPYGDELLPVLQYMTIGPGSHRDGTMDGPGFAKFLAEYYSNYTGRLNKSSRAMMEALLQGGHGWPECGDPRDTQANNFVKVIPLVARYAGRPGLVKAVDAAVRAQQNNDEAVMYGLVAALVLERVVLGSRISEAVRWAAEGAPGSGVSLSRTALEALQAVVRHAAAGTPLRELLYAPGSGTKAGSWGPSCANPGALQGALLAAMQASHGVSGADGSGNSGGTSSTSSSSSRSNSSSSEGGDDTVYSRGVRVNMLLGGDNCSRGVLLGALLAAEHGPASIPFSWRSQTRVYHSSEVLAEHLMEFRSPGAGAGTAGQGGARRHTSSHTPSSSHHRSHRAASAR